VRMMRPYHPLYPPDSYRDVHVLSSVGRDPVLVPPASSLPGLHAGLSVVDIVPPQHPNKRPRMDPRDSNLRPLSIDTRDTKEPGYHPQVEAISPTPEDRPAERDDVRSTKDDLLQKIAKVDREIAKAESQIAKLKKKQADLEDAANRPTSDSATEEEKPANQSIAQLVYSENRRKAGKSHALLDKLAAGNDLPLYNQPSDTTVYNQNKRNYTAFKKKLVEYFKKRSDDREVRDRYYTETYSKLTFAWTKKVERIENSRKRKEKEAKCREMYEKIFPELRKQREDKERDARLGTRGSVRSEADIEDVIERLQEQELEDKKMHAYAVIPPLLLPPQERRRKFTNNNGLTQDPLLIYNERKFINMWTDAETEIFREKYLQHPKNFGLIAQYLERKTVSDCVQYYYLSKKTANYKQLLRKSRQRNRGARRGQPAQTGEVIAPNVTGVVTRRTVADMQQNKESQSRSNTPQPNTPVKMEMENGEEEQDNDKEGRGKDRGGREKKPEQQNESSDEDDICQSVKGGPHPCVVCKVVVDHSRPVQKSQIGQLGIKEEDFSPETRVCNNCWCKNIRKKHAHCPLPSCTTSKGRVKGRLRHLPTKLNDLPKSSKESLVNEFQIPDGTKKCCTACFTRLTRRITTMTGVENAMDQENVDWSPEETEMAKQSLRQNGNNWAKMAEKITSKTEEQCKQFFYSQRKKLQLDKIVQEFKKANLPEGSAKPTLTSDEEESGSSTSSCEDEPMQLAVAEGQSEESQQKENKTTESTSTTTTSTNTKAEVKSDDVVGPVQKPIKPEEDYDSSATMSADEVTGDMAGRNAPARSRTTNPATTTVATSLPPPPAQTTATTVARGDVLTVKDLMTTVIESSLERDSSGSTSTCAAPPPAVSVPLPVVTTAVKKPDIPNLTQMIHAAGPSPHQTNYVRNNLKGKVPRPDLEVRSMAPPQQPAAVACDGEAMNLTVPTRRERSPPQQAASLGPRDTYRDPPSGARQQQPDTRGTPPQAHGGSKLKLTHQNILSFDPYRDQYRPDNKSPAPPAPYSDGRSVHSPGPNLVHRGDPRRELPTQKGIHAGGSKPALTISTGGRTGSIVTGTPVSQHSPRYDPIMASDKPSSHGGSITRGIPVYPDRRHPTNLLQDPSRASLPGSGGEFHKRTASPAYNPYPTQRPASHEQAQPRSSVSSRSVLENDFRTAKTLSRPDVREEFPSRVHHRDLHRPPIVGDPRAPIVGDPRAGIDLGRGGDPRIPDGRIYSDPRILPRENVHGDPRADIPPRHEPRDLRPEQRPEIRTDLRPEMRMDPREARGSELRDPRDRGDGRVVALDRPSSYYNYVQRSGRRTPPTSRTPVIQPQLPRNSITSGQPIKRPTQPPHRDPVDIYRHPEVSITKQPASVASSRHEYGGLNALVDVAVQQPKLPEVKDRLPTSSALGTSRAEPRGVSSGQRFPEQQKRPYDPRPAPADPGRYGVGGGQSRIPAQVDLERQRQQLMLQLNQMSESDRLRLLDDQRRAAVEAGGRRDGVVDARPESNTLTAANLIDIIITHQINQGGVPGAEKRSSPQSVADGKESPCKATSRSPSVKSAVDGADDSGSSRCTPTTATVGEHIESMINKEVSVTSRDNRTSPFTTGQPEMSHEHWKRRPTYHGDNRPVAAATAPLPRQTGSVGQLGSDERQIIRVAQNASPRSDKSVSRSGVEPISPPTGDPAGGRTMYYPPNSADPMSRFLAAQQRQGRQEGEAGKSGANLSPFDYVKHKIAEVMKKGEGSEGGKVTPVSGAPVQVSMGPPHKRPHSDTGSPPVTESSSNPESPRKRYKGDDGTREDLPDSPGSGEMVIDESARPDSAHSHKTSSPAPGTNTDTSHYRAQAAARSSPGMLPPRTTPATNSVPLARYEPLSDDD